MEPRPSMRVVFSVMCFVSTLEVAVPTDVEQGPSSHRVVTDLLKTVQQKYHQAVGLSEQSYSSNREHGMSHAYLPVIRKLNGEFTLYLSVLQETSFLNWTIFGVYSLNKTLPFFEFSTHTSLLEERRIFTLRYQGVKSYQRLTFTLPKVTFEKLMMWMNSDTIGLVIDCGTEIEKHLTQRIAEIPNTSTVTLGQNGTGGEKFKGMLLQAKLYPEELDVRPWHCGEEEEMQADQNGGGDDSERLSILESQVNQLILMVDILKTQNKDLTRRLEHRETCECRPLCSLNGPWTEEGDIWENGFCTRCICRHGVPQCSKNLPQCSAPCRQGPCQHGGTCRPDSGGDNFECDCPKPYGGQRCERRLNPCVWPRDKGHCNQIMLRFYYDRFSQTCLPFNYTGCGGNMNNYETQEQCEAVSLTGACCYRQYSISLSDVISGKTGTEQNCKRLSLGQCKEIHHQQQDGKESEVLSFYPGMDCEQAQCFTPSGRCHVDKKSYRIGETIQYRCQQCTCQTTGLFLCKCSSPTRRREIRTLSTEEMVRFQKGVKALHKSGIWDELRDLYMAYSMHSNGGPLFLPWNRLFLHRVEAKLQEVDCDIFIPYFDFTTDVGNFEDAVIWQPNYVGGNGEGPMSCVPDHLFGIRKSWSPCLSRSFNTSIKLPSVAELALVLKNEDFNKMSISLEAFAAYVHNFIGGDMATTAAAYDPVFYVIHAYIDQLYWTWQQQHETNKFKFPAVFGNVRMLPYDIAPKDVLDSENTLCTSYAKISEGNVCNITLTPPNLESAVFVEEARGYDLFGYDKEGFDRRGFDRFSFKKNGYNRDGYDREGYNKEGYNRLGYNHEGYDVTGFDVLGQDRGGSVDTSGLFDDVDKHQRCRQRSGLNTEGYDQYGFSIDGYDVNFCNFSYNGPFSPIQSFRIWNTLLKQTPTFIKSLPRLCPSLKPLPLQWFDLHWITSPYDVTGLVKDEAPTLAPSQPSLRFCVDTDSLLSSCPCSEGLASCTDNPCLTTNCPAYPDAICTVSFCGDCQARWSVGGVIVDCHQPRDYCLPNPCQHGGVCVPSVWPPEPQLTTCQCSPGYDGPLCQHPALDVCELPVNLGRCKENMTRWYFNPQISACEEFIYTGCLGNANNFLSFKACRNRCMIGACCSRSSRMPGHIHGFDLQGYDRYGFNYLGLDQDGNKRTKDVATEFGDKRLDKNGFDWRGYDREGYDFEGLDHHGFDRGGYSRQGFNLSGFNQFGEYDGIIDYNNNGFDGEGYDRAGFNCYGFNRDDVDYEGLVGGYRYDCRHTTLQQCQELEDEIGEVVQFTPGRRCHQVGCENRCGCNHYNRTLKFGEDFTSGCQRCTCTRRGVVVCHCSKDLVQERKEVRDMPRIELERFQNAVKSLSGDYHSRWYKLAEMYAMYKPQFSGTPNFLPWNRYFLRTVEHALQSIDCDVTIPYLDWTMDVGAMDKSDVWAANILGNNGHSVNGCVRYHPFKEKYPPYWAPCLRRHFNATVNLLDAVDIEKILRETSYEKFRLRVELMSNLFQLWGGGHMVTDLAAYDPAFLSHLAFIDKLWTNWQERNKDHVFKFPVEHRFTLLPPFAVSPDDIMDCEKQMCVKFVPVGEGIPCNESIPSFGYNKKGFDRHGFDKEGYNEFGYNKSGYSRDGKFDDGNTYDAKGFDKQGFGRHGYDQMGIDRYGFRSNTFNLDGFDSHGYDRTGYNRYGFDRSGRTPFGFHRNNTDLNDFNNIRKQIFDPYGYNRLGFNKFGYDRQGYDVFGYNSTGFNKEKCRHYFVGPMYLIVKRLVSQQLKFLDDKDLRLLVRVCPGTSTLPEWIYTRNWLQRGNQVPLSLDIETSRKLSRVQSEESLRKSSGMEGDLWVPEPPDRRFCFVTYQYSECPMDQPAVTCKEELCEERKCPGHPEAGCWTRGCRKCYPDYYDGISGNTINCTGCIDNEGRPRAENTTWQTSECRICQCQRGNVGCQRIDCPPVQCQHPVKVKGQCCPSCEAGCLYKDKVYKENETHFDEFPQCNQCTCSHGNMTCKPKACSDIHNCILPRQVEGECCPVCTECEGHEEGEQWAEAPCRTCTCTNGEKMCTKTICPKLPCAHPYTPEGECCPVCLGCYYGDVIYQDGEEFQPDGCSVCRCNQGDVQCVTKTCPSVRCENPVTSSGLCCPVCDAACIYEGTIYRHTEVFSPSYDPCLNCSCTNSIVQCIPVTCSHLQITCETPVKLPGQCCATECPKCTHNGQQYEHGEIWTPDEYDCEICECREGLVSCKVQQVCGLECTHGVVARGKCCPECADCLYDGRVIPNGRYFSRPGDACQQCMCRYGNIQCEIVDLCPRLSCTKTESVAGTCCPICKGCHHEGRFFRHSASVPSPNKCTDCACVEGEIQCTPKPCPQITCNDPQVLEGECCPVCNHCLYNQILYEDGETFTPARNPCYKCTCSNGHVDCTESIQCDTPTCTHPARVRSQCCPVCEHCDFERRRFTNGQMFSPPSGDPCQVCTCKTGSVTCERIQCTPVNCANAHTPPGHCCETCPPSCRFQGLEYPDGEEFDEPRDRCSLCVCKSGIVLCRPKPCETPTCTHPARAPGECCPSCNFCVHDRRLFRNGHTFRHPSDKCLECNCKDGSVTCDHRPCPPLSCLDPITDPGECCPVCAPETCEFQGQQYQQGQRLPSPRDPCEGCVCERGQVSCQRKPCPTVQCSHPLNGECCPSCDGCTFLGRSIAAGQTLRNPYSRCEECSCAGGNITCAERECAPVTCLHPAPLDCCPSCRQCLYQGRQYRDGQRFPDGQKSCHECTCTSGNVTCGPVTCGANLPCQNPAQGQCCLECNDCSFFDKRYRNGLAFEEPTNECKVCLCRDGNVDCRDKTCPPVQCRNPVQGKCCPECSDCLLDDVLYEDGKVFPHATDSCQECVCQRGSIRCSAKQCPNTLCSHPVKAVCCEECSGCNFLQENYEDGHEFDNPRNPCELCHCVRGNVHCQRKTCPLVQCSHPSKGRCCPECGNCLYKNREYPDQQVIRDDNQPCDYCQCNHGNVECQPKQCVEPTCTHPAKGRCCPECVDCLYGKLQFKNQQTFADRTDPCKLCQCQNGNAVCRQRQCGRLACRHPVQGECCKECEDCLYDGIRRRNNLVFRDQDDDCKLCQCTRGTVVCRRRVCHTPTCRHPVQGECCPECNKCLFEGKIYENEEGFTESEGCHDCRCEQGTMMCRTPQCPPVMCRHPVQGACCQECDGCSYNGDVYDNGQRFPDPADECKQCECVDGTVRCQARPCPVMTCRHPVKIDCCFECSDCYHDNRTIRSGTDFPHSSDPCQRCTCQRGTVSCRRKECPITYCTHPVEGPCCLQCGGQCLYQGQILDHGQSVKMGCQTCLCVKGNVQCEKLRCPVLTCLHPVTLPDQCCPECSACFYNGRHFTNDQVFSDRMDSCKECRCEDGTVTCSKRPCPSVSCEHPILGKCCPVCGADCLYKGRRISQGASFPDTEHQCQSCSCRGGTVVCENKRCDPAPCRHPAPDECGCGQCDGCTFHGTSVGSGQGFIHPSDLCQSCTCQAGNVVCEAVTCEATCTHPAANDHCCPVCDQCLYEGQTYDNAQEFTSPEEPCLSCTCKSGSVTCERKVCLEPRCANPIRRDGHCCFECPVCKFYDKQYQDGDKFIHPEDGCKRCTCSGGRVSCGREPCVTECTHPRPDPCCPACDECYYEGQLVGNGETFRPDPCRTCFCTNGDVVCEEKQCPKLDCLKTVTQPGECCPKCSGCMYEGIHYDEGSNWILEDNPCVSCMCSVGVITCDELSCLTMCDNAIRMPGQCCPVCPTCKYNGASYDNGDMFNPNGDPCDLCKCMEGHLRCIHETCPNVNHCPSEQIVPAKPGVCCPTCAGFGTNCTREHLGMTLRPRPDDPCFVCECKESFNWICRKESCEALACPVSQQKPVPDQCCPQCPVCFVRRSGQYYHEGEEWQDEENPCITCVCKEGSVQCSIVDCPVVQCADGEDIIKPPGRCCEVCAKTRKLSCLHRGRHYQADEEWKADECTSCVCRGGKPQCRAQQCSPLNCQSDEIPSLSPGSCCPVCLAKPATCIVFGDPHYKTFDGTTYHFQGTCKYVMASDCEGGDFTVEVQHDDRGVEEKVSWAQNLTVKLAEFTIELLQNHIVKTGGSQVSLPYFQEPYFYVERSENTILLNTNLGVKLSWDGSSTAELSVPGTYKRKTCGLCGNFNGFPQDDMKTRQGRITNSPAVFGNSWKVNSECGDAEDIDPCAKAGYRAKKIANVKCAVLKSDLFARCHRVISPEPFFSSCVFDMCVCSEDADCLCNILASYAHECAKAGVRLQWRSSALCAISCPVDKGFIFDECGPPCPRTCENRNTPLSNSEAYCFKPCIPGCQCVAGKVVHDGRCIDQDDCPT